jgi:Tfp pilus assembly protein PilV
MMTLMALLVVTISVLALAEFRQSDDEQECSNNN